MCKNVNFDTAKEKHLSWKKLVKDFIEDKGTIPVERLIDHTQCDLGKWFYAEGKEKYGHIESMQRFEMQHIKLHALAKDIYDFKIAEDDYLPDYLASELYLTSDKIVALLTQSENEINKQ